MAAHPAQQRARPDAVPCSAVWMTYSADRSSAAPATQPKLNEMPTTARPSLSGSSDVADDPERPMLQIAIPPNADAQAVWDGKGCIRAGAEVHAFFLVCAGPRNRRSCGGGWLYAALVCTLS